MTVNTEQTLCMARGRESSSCVPGYNWSTYWTWVGFKSFTICSLQPCGCNFLTDKMCMWLSSFVITLYLSNVNVRKNCLTFFLFFRCYFHNPFFCLFFPTTSVAVPLLILCPSLSFLPPMLLSFLCYFFSHCSLRCFSMCCPFIPYSTILYSFPFFFLSSLFCLCVAEIKTSLDTDHYRNSAT